MFTSVGCRKTRPSSKSVRAAATAILCLFLLLQLEFSSSISAAAAAGLRPPCGVNHEKVTDASFQQPEIPDDVTTSSPLTHTKEEPRNVDEVESRMQAQKYSMHRKLISCLQLRPSAAAVQLRTTATTLHSLYWQRLPQMKAAHENPALPGYSFMKTVRDLLMHVDGATTLRTTSLIKSRSSPQSQHRKTRKLFMTSTRNIAAASRATRIPSVHADDSASYSDDDTHLDYSDPRTHPPRGN
ncbi:unnamed protein product [Sphagnum tenellum]